MLEYPVLKMLNRAVRQQAMVRKRQTPNGRGVTLERSLPCVPESPGIQSKPPRFIKILVFMAIFSILQPLNPPVANGQSTFYSIQVGAFKHSKNAAEEVSRLKKLGIHGVYRHEESAD
jgi:hypothetical protein